MAAVSAHDVARDLRDRLPGVGTVKIHKLLYFAQGLHLGLTGEPIFTEPIEAWTMGPVVADFWRDEKRQRPLPDPRPLSASAVSVIDEVIRRYRDTSPQELIRLTHSDGGPWCQVTEAGDELAPSQNQPITRALMASWFEQDEAVQADRAASARLRERRRQLEALSAEDSGLLESLARVSAGEILCQSRP
jgi:uncharacterized phage-associated protein